VTPNPVNLRMWEGKRGQAMGSPWWTKHFWRKAVRGGSDLPGRPVHVRSLGVGPR